MILQKQPNDWSCLVTAFAMAMGIKVEALIYVIGHDGSKDFFEKVSYPYNKRSFHVQEILDSAIRCFDYVFCEIEFDPCLSGDGIENKKIHDGYTNELRFKSYLDNCNMVLIGIKKLDPIGRRHAVAWSALDKKIFDPNGLTYEFNNFIVRGAYAVIKIGKV